MTQIHHPPTHSVPAAPATPSATAHQPRSRAELTGYRKGFDIAYAALSVLFLLAVLVQMFLAGLGAFHHRGAPGPGFGPHETLGNSLGIAAIVIFVVSLVARASWRTVICALVLALLTELAQHALAQFGHDDQWIGAVHALDGMFILLLAAGLAWTSVRRVRSSDR